MSDVSRRAALTKLGMYVGGAGLGVVAGKEIAAATKLWTPSAAGLTVPARPKGPVQPQASCVLTGQQTEGPYYHDARLVRRDMTDGKPGLPLILDVEVVANGTCTPISNAIVDIWHCDDQGIYSAFRGQLGGLDTRGENFLRGVQVTDSTGKVRFHTIYPGWYPGRCVHIHFTVWVSNNRRVTAQWYFDDSITDEVYAVSEPYFRRTGNRTLNSRDGIYTPATLLKLTPVPGAYHASFQVAVA